MKKNFSRCDFLKICKPICSLDFHRYGLAFRSGGGMFWEKDIDEFQAAVERHPELHIVSMQIDSSGCNYYRPGSDYYLLCLGDKDPTITISPSDPNYILTQEEVDRINEQIKQIWKEAENDPIWNFICGGEKFDPTP